jgi:hypothetical protein
MSVVFILESFSRQNKAAEILYRLETYLKSKITDRSGLDGCIVHLKASKSDNVENGRLFQSRR